MNDEKVTLPANLVNAIVAYLSKRPFDEVVGLISGIHQESQGDKSRAVPPPVK